MEHYKYSRAFVLVLALFLGHVQVANAQIGAPDYGKHFLPPSPADTTNQAIYKKQNNNQWFFSLNPNGYPTPSPLTAPSPSPKPLGNWNLTTEGGSPTAQSKTNFKFPNSNPEIVDVKAKFKMRDLAGALGRFASKVLTPFAIGSALYDLARELGFWVSRNPDGSVKYEKDGYDQTTNPYWVQANPIRTNFDPVVLCQSFTDRGAFLNFTVSTNTGEIAGICNYVGGAYIGIRRCVSPNTLVNTSCQPATLSKLPSTQQEFEDFVANKPSWSDSSKIRDAIKQAIDSGERVETDTPTITGPVTSTVPKVETTSKPDGATETKTTTNTYTYEGNKVTNATTNTVINNYNPTTNTTTTTTTTNNKPEEPLSDPCDSNPNRIGCLEIDTPDISIPKKTETLTYVAESLFGGGTCPQPLHWSMPQQMAQGDISYQPACDILTNYVRAIVIALAAYFAFGIIMEGLKS